MVFDTASVLGRTDTLHCRKANFQQEKTMKHSDNIAELAAALAKAQGDMNAAKIDSENKFQHWKYSSLGAVTDAVKKPLSANSLSYAQAVSMTETSVTVTTLLMHASGQWIETEISAEPEGNKSNTFIQTVGIAITYLRRYSLAAMVGVCADEDTDGATDDQAQKSQQAQRQQQSQKTSAKPAQNDKRVGYPEEDMSVPQDDEPELSPELAAAAAVTDSKGNSYASLKSPELQGHATNLAKWQNEEGKTVDQKERAQNKIKAITLILSARASGILPNLTRARRYPRKRNDDRENCRNVGSVGRV
jgi:hypothetical protein